MIDRRSRPGLIGVAPNRTPPSATEQARAEVALVSQIHHADGSVANGGSLDFGLRMFERQLPLSPANFEDFHDVEFIGGNTSTNVFDSFKDNSVPGEHNFNPRATLDAVTVPVSLGTLGPGDWRSFTYTLTAVGTTAGSEHGDVAFLGDPFTLDAAGTYGPTLGTAPVPLPASAGLLACGLAGLRQRRGRKPDR